MVCELRKPAKDVFPFASIFRNVGVVISLGMIFSTIFASYQIFYAHVFPKRVCTGGGSFADQISLKLSQHLLFLLSQFLEHLKHFRKFLNFSVNHLKKGWLVVLLFTFPVIDIQYGGYIFFYSP